MRDKDDLAGRKKPPVPPLVALVHLPGGIDVGDLQIGGFEHLDPIRRVGNPRKIVHSSVVAITISASAKQVLNKRVTPSR